MNTLAPSPSSTARLLVYALDRLVCIKIQGRANFTSSVDFKSLIHEMMDQGYKSYIIDLSECVLMDSTFLGVLAGFGLKMKSNAPADSHRSGIELLNPNSRISELLENLGVLHLFRVVSGTAADYGPGTERVSSPCSRDQVTSICLEAHRALMDIDPANVAKFKDVTKFLAEDLKKSKSLPASN